MGATCDGTDKRRPLFLNREKHAKYKEMSEKKKNVSTIKGGTST